MQLTRKERWILVNQYRILEKLETEEFQREGWTRIREGLEQGYETDYDQFCQHILDGDDVMTEAESDEVHRIMAMYDAMRRSIAKQGLPEGVEEWQTTFSGFDGNHEGKHLGYVRYFCADNRYVDFPRGDNFNSHIQMLATYRRQLPVWEACGERKEYLTQDDVKRIASAAVHPSNR